MPLKIITLGCRLNAYESELMQEVLSSDKLPSTTPKDIIVVNTCAVTGEAERQCRQTIRKLRKESPQAFIIVTGCAAQIHPEIYAALPEVNKVIGNKEKLNIASFLTPAPKVETSDFSTLSASAFPKALITSFADRHKAFLQIQQGCDNTCTFCIVNKARGKSRSCSPKRILSEAERLLKSGFQEFTLAGVNIASYGKDTPAYGNLTSLTQLILEHFPEISRLRFSSLDPAELSKDFITLMKDSPRLMPHLHLSIQSGSDLTLKRMGRRHTQAQVLALCKSLQTIRPDIIFGSDFITGFPTETEEMFKDTETLIKSAPITLSHIFPYSERSGTPAAKMPPVPVPTRKERAARLRKLSADILAKYLASRIGSTETILLETPFCGTSEHYTKVELSAPLTAGTIAQVKITGADTSRLILKGELL